MPPEVKSSIKIAMRTLLFAVTLLLAPSWVLAAEVSNTSCSPAAEVSDTPAKRESPELYPLTAIVANAEKFDGQEITTFGYYISGDHISALCPSREVASTSECIFLTTDGSEAADIDNVEGRALMVMGGFAAQKPGTSSFYAGRIEAWRVSAIPETKNK